MPERRGINRHPSGDLILLQHQLGQDFGNNTMMEVDTDTTEASDKSPDTATQEMEQSFSALMNPNRGSFTATKQQESKQQRKQRQVDRHGSFGELITPDRHRFSNDFEKNAMPVLDELGGGSSNKSNPKRKELRDLDRNAKPNSSSEFDPFASTGSTRSALDDPFSEESRKAAGRGGGGGAFEERTVMSWQSSDRKRNIMREHTQLRSAQRMQKLKAEVKGKDENDITEFPEPEFSEPVVHQRRGPRRRASIGGSTPATGTLTMESYQRQMSSRSVATSASQANNSPVPSLLGGSIHVSSPAKPRSPATSSAMNDMGYGHAVPDSDQQHSVDLFRQTHSPEGRKHAAIPHVPHHSPTPPGEGFFVSKAHDHAQIWDKNKEVASGPKSPRRASLGSSNHSLISSSDHRAATKEQPTGSLLGGDKPGEMKKSMSSVELYKQVHQQQQQQQQHPSKKHPVVRRASVGHAPKPPAPDGPPPARSAGRRTSAGGLSSGSEYSARGRRTTGKGSGDEHSRRGKRTSAGGLSSGGEHSLRGRRTTHAATQHAQDDSTRRRSSSVGVKTPNRSQRGGRMLGGDVPGEEEHSMRSRSRRNSTGARGRSKSPGMAVSLHKQASSLTADGYSVISGVSSRSISTPAAAPISVSEDTVRRLVREKMSRDRSRSRKRVDEPSDHDDSYSTSSDDSDGDSDIDETEFDEDESSVVDITEATTDPLNLGAASEKVKSTTGEVKGDRKHKKKKEGKKTSSKSSRSEGDKEKKKAKKTKKDGEKKKSKKSATKTKDNGETKESTKLKKKSSSASADDKHFKKKKSSRRIADDDAAPESPGKSLKKKVSRKKLGDEVPNPSGSTMKKSKSSAALDQEGKKKPRTKLDRRKSTHA